MLRLVGGEGRFAQNSAFPVTSDVRKNIDLQTEKLTNQILEQVSNPASPAQSSRPTGEPVRVTVPAWGRGSPDRQAGDNFWSERQRCPAERGFLILLCVLPNRLPANFARRIWCPGKHIILNILVTARLSCLHCRPMNIGKYCF